MAENHGYQATKKVFWGGQACSGRCRAGSGYDTPLAEREDRIEIQTVCGWGDFR